MTQREFDRIFGQAETVADNGEGYCAFCSGRIRLNQIIHRSYEGSRIVSVKHARIADCCSVLAETQR